jgi:hypothetical protein
LRPAILLSKESTSIAPIAQLDRVPDYESVGRRFESYWAHQKNQGFAGFP